MQLGGKNARKTLKLLAQHGPDSVNLVVNGTLKPGPQAGTWVIAEASFQTFVKQPPETASGTASNLTQPPK